MPLQNRVDPLGDVHAVEERGTFTGNRGVIHDPETKTLLKRRWTTKAWIICTCEFRGRKRQVMGRNAPSGAAGWTELFFLDEVTALAAGHRPCFYCRRQRAEAFIEACAAAFDGTPPKASRLDARLHDERLASGGEAFAVDGSDFGALPDGAMLASDRRCFVKHGGALRRWSFGGYGPPSTFAQLENTRLITPRTTLVALTAGYLPAWHQSIGGAVERGT
ncbi:MAG TPA: hypothetical protein VNS34_21475 [Rhizobiaceae bacterium]|nr:hypothetical protein [Rhizobiaceae bacterium]